jgi:hypothetical protein
VTNSDIDSSIAVLRALLTEDFDTYRHLNAELDRSANKVFAAVLGAAFTEAATRRFGEKPSIPEIIEFVAETRAVYSRTGEIVAAEDAEHMIRAALGEDHLVDNMNGRAMGAAQTAMLFALVHEASASAAQIDDLLTVAEERVSSYFERKPR